MNAHTDLLAAWLYAGIFPRAVILVLGLAVALLGCSSPSVDAGDGSRRGDGMPDGARPSADSSASSRHRGDMGAAPDSRLDSGVADTTRDRDGTAVAPDASPADTRPADSAPGSPDAQLPPPNHPTPAIVRGFNGGLGDMAATKRWGATVIRVFIRDSGAALRMRSQLQQLRELGEVKVVLTTIAPGGRNGSLVDWAADQNEITTRYSNLWRTVASDLRDYRDVIWGYDIMNEPVELSQMPRPPSQWPAIARAIIAAIRSVDDQTWIIYEVGPSGMFWGFKGLQPVHDPAGKVIYSAHFYQPQNFTHAVVQPEERNLPMDQVTPLISVLYPTPINFSRPEWDINGLLRPPMSLTAADLGARWTKETTRKVFAPARAFQLAHRVPVFVGEFSAASWMDPDSLLAWLGDAVSLFEEYGWSWAYFAFNSTGSPSWDPQMPEGPQHFQALNARDGFRRPARSETTRRAIFLKNALTHPSGT